MEQTTLQKRIEERAKYRLLQDLYDATQKEIQIASLINTYNRQDEKLWDSKLAVDSDYRYSGTLSNFTIRNDYTQKVFDALLPRYVTQQTDDLLDKIDQIDLFAKTIPDEN